MTKRKLRCLTIQLNMFSGKRQNLQSCLKSVGGRYGGELAGDEKDCKMYVRPLDAEQVSQKTPRV